MLSSTYRKQVLSSQCCLQVVDVQMVLTDGASHQVDSSELAFSLATKGAFKQAFDKAGPQVCTAASDSVLEVVLLSGA